MVKHRIKSLFLLLTCPGCLLLPVSVAWAAEEPVPPPTKDWSKFFSVLFDTCVVLTVRDAHVQIDNHTPHAHILVLSAHVDELLAGDMGQPPNVDLVFDQAKEKIFASVPIASLNGRKIVLAFRHATLESDSIRLAVKSQLPVLEILNVVAPFPDQQFTEQDLKTLRKSRPPEIYPYTACLELLLKRIEDRTDEKGGTYPMTATVTGQILKVLRNSARDIGRAEKDLAKAEQKSGSSLDFRKGEFFRFLVTAEQWDKIFKEKRVSELIGTKCVLSFDCGEKGVGEAYRLYAPGTPFAEQKYSETEVEDFSAKLRASTEYMKLLKSELQAYIEERWSKERIRQFCQPQTRNLPRMQGMYFESRNGFLEGRLYPEAEKELGKIRWYCSLNAGMPDQYQVDVYRGKHQFWILEVFRPSLPLLTDDELTKSILRQKLLNGWLAYVMVRNEHTKEIGSDLGPIVIRSVNKLIRSDKARVIGFEGTLERGQTVSGDVSNDLEISNILVDGKPNALFNDILGQETQNIDKLFQASQ